MLGRRLRPVRGLIATAAVLAMLVVLMPTALAAEPGDEPGTAIAASAGTTQYDSTAMTESAADPAACPDPEFPGPFAATMWFSYAPTRDALTVVDVNSFVSDGSTDYLAILFVFAKTNGGMDLVACSAYPAQVTIPAQAGTTYLIMVGGLTSTPFPDDPALLGHGGTFDLTITPIRGRILRDQFHASDTFVDEGLTEACGDGEVVGSFKDRGSSTTFFNATGPRVFTFHISGRTMYQMGDGPIVTVSYHETFYDYLDGTVADIGTPLKVSVDGKTFLIDAGKVVRDSDGNIIFEAGPHPILENGFDLCALLTG